MSTLQSPAPPHQYPFAPPHQYPLAPPHQYPQVIQLKLYQAFIFSIPVFLSIILFMLFYLFYLKRLSSRELSTRPVLPRTTNDASSSMSFDQDLKNELKNKLRTISFDECVETMDSMCCVCLAEFELKEELLQVTSCKHMFHTDCIRHWFRKNSTCPLCRAVVVVISTPGSSTPSVQSSRRL